MSDVSTFDALPHDKPRGIKRLLGGMLLAVAGTLALSAWAQNDPPAPGFGHGPRMHQSGMGGPGMFMGRPEQLNRMVDHMLDGVGASDAQRAQIKQIVQAAAADLKTQHEAARGLHDKGLQLLAAPTIDTAAVESLRQQAEAQHDQASRRVTQGLIDVAKVLTPEQRTKLAQRMKMREDQMRDRMQRAQRDKPSQPPK
ncbi:Spy/CpxP family protein refolding chaperone [Rhizobacter sp. SG703]|uniref:Spy/CpxP family protein refolding chaperone n=1 Tax=Rhizobacter sp. SG703 TaxID=2587140 RepID=UPI0014456711|nr:Spy/CpxP family protein refolding chaperone [Rhizobacter sp. SG703]NKI94776.1 Spy/CpxP family protein refolding chaperone [Rhizobacter sp. SG703]